jgi:hypothetical protein
MKDQIIENHNILMSPLLSDRFNKIEKKLENIEISYKDINDKFDTILKLLLENSERWESNKKEYIELLEKNQKISEKNYDILNDNKSIYRDTLKSISSSNNSVLYPFIEKLQSNNNKLCDNMDPRIYNRFWRTSGTNTIMQPPSNFSLGSFGNLPWFLRGNQNKK